MMLVTAIAAMDRRGLIGSGGGLPWHLPADLRRFRRATMGKPVVMGRKTFESLSGPLDGRLNIVLSRRPLEWAGVRAARSVEAALAIAAEAGAAEVMICGGASVYEATRDLWDRVLLTVVEGEFRGDAHFPIAALGPRWQLTEFLACAADDRNPHPYTFLALERTRETRP